MEEGVQEVVQGGVPEVVREVVEEDVAQEVVREVVDGVVRYAVGWYGSPAVSGPETESLSDRMRLILGLHTADSLLD